jgi:hypothetical protein
MRSRRHSFRRRYAAVAQHKSNGGRSPRVVVLCERLGYASGGYCIPWRTSALCGGRAQTAGPAQERMRQVALPLDREKQQLSRPRVPTAMNGSVRSVKLA